MAADLELFTSAEALRGAMARDEVQIVAVDDPGEFAGGHIPGARQTRMADFTARAGDTTGGLLPEPDVLSRCLAECGLRDTAHIVAYDRVGDGPAARLLYTLDAMGHDRISLLDGGLAAWQAAGLPLESGPPTPLAGDFKAVPQPDRIADHDWIEAHRGEPGVRLLDTRSAAEYSGEDVRSARGGHIPGAVHLDWQLLKRADGRRRDAEDIRRLLAERGIEPAQEFVAYCQTHVRSSYVYLVLRALGYPRVRGYPGAWSDWGNRPDTPVATGS